MQLKTACTLVVIAGTLLIWFIKFFLRPWWHPPGSAGFVLGIAPNLLGSFLIPFGAYWLYHYPKFSNSRLLRFSFCADLRLVCVAGFGLLVVNEYLQKIPFFGRTFDYFDMLSSAAGLLLSYYSFLALQRRQQPVLR